MDFLSIFVARFVLLFFGLVGNSAGIVVFYRKKMKKITTNKIYRTMLFMDSFFLCTQIFQDSALSLGLDLRNLSTLSCKIRYYWNYSIGPVSPWLLVYITVERYIAIQHSRITLLKSENFQKITMVLILIYNLSIYSPMAILKQVFSKPLNSNATELYYFCDFFEPVQSTIMMTLDLVNSALAPFTIMLAFSIALICVIFKKRLRILDMRSKRDKRRLVKDIRFAFSSIMLNLTFVAFNLPLCLTNIFFPYVSGFLFNVFIVLFYCTFCINFYVLAFFNYIFRDELLIMLNLREPEAHNKTKSKKNTADPRSASGKNTAGPRLQSK